MLAPRRGVERIDPRRAKLKYGLSQLTSEELLRIVARRGEGMVFDNYNYEESTGFY